MTELKTERQFSTGTLTGFIEVKSSDGTFIPSRMLDTINADFQAMLDSRIIPACSDLAPDASGQQWSTAVYSNTHKGRGITVRVRVRLTVRRSGLDETLSRIMAHKLVETHSLPYKVAAELARHAAEVKKIEQQLEEGLAIDDPFDLDDVTLLTPTDYYTVLGSLALLTLVTASDAFSQLRNSSQDRFSNLPRGRANTPFANSRRFTREA